MELQLVMPKERRDLMMQRKNTRRELKKRNTKLNLLQWTPMSQKQKHILEAAKNAFVQVKEKSTQSK